MSEVDKELRRLLASGSPSLSPMIQHFLETKGKGVRPVLVLWCGDIAGSPMKRSIDLAVAAELLHMASLVHDDIVDQAAFRRKKPTIHRMWGEGAAVLVGDYFFGTLLRVISPYPMVVPHFAEAILSLVNGEFMQMDQQYDPWISEEEYLNRICQKTANFMSTCCKIGCLTQDTPFEIMDALTNYGYCIGMAYQLLDDLQDIIETSEGLGKPIMQDISRGIFTLPYLHSFWQESNRLPTFLKVNIVPSADSLEYTRKLAAHYIEKSVICLSSLPSTNGQRGLLCISRQIKKKLEQLQEVNAYAPTLD
ncbi:polyprenyl synthetase family protein [Effusibacillus consociatus]